MKEIEQIGPRYMIGIPIDGEPPEPDREFLSYCKYRSDLEGHYLDRVIVSSFCNTPFPKRPVPLSFDEFLMKKELQRIYD